MSDLVPKTVRVLVTAGGGWTTERVYEAAGVEAEIARLRDRLREAEALLADADERAYLAHGVAELAMKHRDAAEAEIIPVEDRKRALLYEWDAALAERPKDVGRWRAKARRLLRLEVKP